MTLYELLVSLTPCNHLNIQIDWPSMKEFNEKINKITIYSHKLLDDICETTLKKIEVEFMSLYNIVQTGMPYIRVFVNAKTESALIPLLKRILNVTFGKESNQDVTHEN